MSLTKNTKENRQVVVAKYSVESVFQIPDGLDLEDKSVVEEWWIRYDTLYIRYADKNKELEEITATWECSEDLKYPAEMKVTPADDVGFEYDEEELEEQAKAKKEEEEEEDEEEEEEEEEEEDEEEEEEEETDSYNPRVEIKFDYKAIAEEKEEEEKLLAQKRVFH